MNRKQVLKRVKNNKKERKITEEENYFSRFVMLLAFLLISLIIGYLVIGIFVNKTITFNKDKEEDKLEEATIDNSKILAGQIFDQKDNSYYVLVYDLSDDKTLVRDWASLYEKDENALTIYVVDSSKKLNSNYIVTKDSNTNPTSYSDLKIISPTLIKIENKKVSEYVEGETSIKDYFKNIISE